ncbi:MAG: DNA adenine methylase [Christensenellaceae bacterium]
MKYMGSKNRIAKYLLPIMLAECERQGVTTWIEPFVGGANMIDKVPDSYDRIGYDLNPHTIAALIGIRDYIDELPNVVTRDFYNNTKGTEPHHINSWVRFGCSFGAKLDNGYASNKDGRNYAEKEKI